MDKEQLAIARLQDAARLSEHRYKKPLMITYSGGKDSQVLVALAERAGINFEVVNSHTTADAPETVYFIRDQFKELEERGIKWPTTTAGARCLRRRWRMSKETRFCPFMRKLTREHWRTAQDRVAESYKDRFGKCIGEKCMAYENGRCKRLEREGTQ